MALGNFICAIMKVILCLFFVSFHAPSVNCVLKPWKVVKFRKPGVYVGQLMMIAVAGQFLERKSWLILSYRYLQRWKIEKISSPFCFGYYRYRIELYNQRHCLLFTTAAACGNYEFYRRRYKNKEYRQFFFQSRALLCEVAKSQTLSLCFSYLE